MIEVELPDGAIAECPDGTPPDVIKGALQKRFSAPKAEEHAEGRHLSYEEGLAELAKEEQDSLSGKTGSFLTGAVGDLTVVGSGLLGLGQRGAAGR